MGQGVVEDGGLDLGRDAVGMRPLGAGKPVDQALGAIGLEIAPDLVELLTGITHHLAGSGDIGEFCGKFEQTELAPCHLVLRGHVVLRWFGLKSGNSILNRLGSGMATPSVALLTLRSARLPAGLTVR